MATVVELIGFLWVGRKCWIAPIVLALLAVAWTGLLLEAPAASRFIYTLF
jgi:hypothetical protein